MVREFLFHTGSIRGETLTEAVEQLTPRFYSILVRLEGKLCNRK